jgi:hypothetical protein
MRKDWLTSWEAAADHPWRTRIFMIGACSVVLLALEAIVGDLTHWETTVIAAATGAMAGLVLAELGLRSSR